MLFAGRWLMGSRIGQIALAVVGALAALAFARHSGRRAEREEQRVDALEETVKIRNDADDALKEVQDDPRTADEILRSQGLLKERED